MNSFMERKFKTLFAVTSFVEVVGWLICLTIILIPLGIIMVLQAQLVKVHIETSNNTRIANEILLEILKNVQNGSDTTASASLANLVSDGNVPANDDIEIENNSGDFAENSIACPNCQFANKADNRYCENCGKELR